MTTSHRGAIRARAALAHAVVETLEPRQLLAAELVKDLDQTGAHGFSWDQSTMIEYGGELYFMAEDLEHGRELWRSDGTEAGTRMVKEAVAGTGGIHVTEMQVANGLLFYLDANGLDLWRSDGSVAGTFVISEPAVRVLDIEAVGNFVYFWGGSNFNELWKTDGTEAGTARVKTFTLPNGATPERGGLTGVGDTLFFWVRSELSRYHLWRSDGTEAGTTRADSGFGFQSSLNDLTEYQGRLYFTAYESEAGNELRVHDPATGVTSLVSDIAPGNDGSSVDELHVSSGLLFFSAAGPSTQLPPDYEVWRTDGTAEGTFMVKDVVPGPETSHPGRFTSFGGRMFFVAHNASDGVQLWKTDGTEPGTELVIQLSDSDSRHNVEALRAVGKRLFFTTQDASGDALWVSDGTTDGTRKLIDMPAGAALGRAISNVGERAYLVGSDGVHGRELWTSDGTAAGTVMVKDIRTGTNGSSPRVVFVNQGLAYYSAQDGYLGGRLWRSDGTTAGTIPLANVSASPALGRLGQSVLFVGGDAVHGRELWKTDGTPEGTVLVKDITPGPGRTDILIGAVLDDALYFAVLVEDAWQLWKSDGTEAGTRAVANLPDIVWGTVSTNGRLIINVGDRLWVSDGTDAGTHELNVATLPPSLRVRQLMLAGDVAYFVADGDQLWKTDGTVEGTVRVGSGFSQVTLLQYAGGQLFFAAYDREHGKELWRTDGTDAGTRMIKDIMPGQIGLSIPTPYVSEPTSVLLGDVMLIQLYGPSQQPRVWRSDGTGAGTFELPIPTYLGIADRPYFSVVGGYAYFTDLTDLYRTDGSVEGSVKLDWEPAGWELTTPGVLASANDSLLFVADDREIGRELWRLAVPTEKTITGTGGDDEWTIYLSPDRARLLVRDDADGAGAPPAHDFGVDEVSSLRFVGLGGDDRITVSDRLGTPFVFEGGAGTDLVRGLTGEGRGSGDFERLDVRRSLFTILDGMTLEELDLTGGGGVFFRPEAGGGDGDDDDETLRVRSLLMTAEHELDVGRWTLVVENADVATIEGLVGRARNDPDMWYRRGITSQFLRNEEPYTAFTLGVGRVGNDVIVKYTLDGDANLDGKVNADDYFAIDSNFLSRAQSPTFAQGDFNYDDRVDADDYFLIDSALLAQASRAGDDAASPRLGAAAAIKEARADATVVSIYSKRTALRVRPADGVWDRPFARQVVRRADGPRR
jgi:ELWxxDGT repeat protein